MAEVNNPDSPIKLQGSIPPKMLEAMKQLKEQKEKPAEQPKPKQAAPKSMEPGPRFFKKEWTTLARPQGSAQLEELIETLRSKSSVYDQIELPSKGKFYNGTDGPADGILHMRAMTGEEEQILATPKFSKKGVGINMIFKKCIKENFNPDLFLSADRLVLLVWLRGISYGSNYEIEIRCPDTEHKFTHKIDLSTDLLINNCPDDFGPEDLGGVLPVSGFKFSYRLGRGIDEVKVQDYREWYTKKHGADASDDSVLFKTSLLLEEVEGLTDKTEIMTLLKKMPIQDVNYLRNVVNDPPFGLDTKISIMSPFSMNEFDLDLPLEGSFFYPKQTRKKEEKPMESLPEA